MEGLSATASALATEQLEAKDIGLELLAFLVFKGAALSSERCEHLNCVPCSKAKRLERAFTVNFEWLRLQRIDSD